MTPDGAADEVLDAFVEFGGRLLDTAHGYGHGLAERAVGAWLARRPAGLVGLIGKGGHPAAVDWTPRLGRDDLLTDARESAQRLGVDRIDTFLTHRDDPMRPAAELADGLRAVVDEGLAERVGVSNIGPVRLAELVATGFMPSAVSNHFGLGVPAGPQPLPGLMTAFDRATQGLLHEHGIPLLAWSAMSAGFFADCPPRRDLVEACTAEPASVRRREVLRAVAAAAGVPPEYVLIRWLVTASPLLFPVVSSSRPERIRLLCRAAGDSRLDQVVGALVNELAPLRDQSTSGNATMRPLLLPAIAPAW